MTKSESTSLSTSEQSTAQSESTSYTTSESQVSNTNNHTESQSSPLGHPEPKEEKKAFSQDYLTYSKYKVKIS